MNTAETPWLNHDEQALWRSWLRVSHDIEAALAHQLLVDHGCSMADYVVLVHLTEAEGGRHRASHLAHKLNWERSRLSHHIARMEARGLVMRSECPSDRRGAYVVVTDAGRAAIAAAAPGHVHRVREVLFDALTPTEQAQLARLLAKVETQLAQAAGKAV